jgi:uncharacterized repeat protein (TIGR03803 family)
VALDKKGNLYGTTSAGGAHYGGTVFKLTPSGTLTTLYSFCSATACADGESPYGGVVLDSKGNLYGTTYDGGNDYNVGTVFMLTPSGTLTTLHTFCSVGAFCSDGYGLQAGVVLDKEGNLYGMTQGSGDCAFCGVVFKLTQSRTFTILYTFTGGTDGSYPTAGVVLDKEGNLYGTTIYGGASNFGTVFKVAPSGTETVLHSFDSNGEDGFWPTGNVALDKKGNVYGTTTFGGQLGVGTVFEVTASGTESIFHSFAAGADGFHPVAGLVFDKKGNLYGTTEYGGSSDFGTVFELTPDGVETILHSFVLNGTDGYYPLYAALSVDKSGNVYGTTQEGGSGSADCSSQYGGCGVVFKIVP